MKSKYKQICEMDVGDMIKTALAGDQPQGGHPGEGCGCGIQQDTDSNVGEFGSTPATEQINISEDEDGGVNIGMDVLSIKLTPAIVEALKVFFTATPGTSDEGEQTCQN